MTGNEVDVTKQGFLQQLQELPPGPIVGQRGHCRRKVIRQVVDQTSLVLRFQEVEIGE
jgi:hypothetical protein